MVWWRRGAVRGGDVGAGAQPGVAGDKPGARLGDGAASRAQEGEAGGGNGALERGSGSRDQGRNYGGDMSAIRGRTVGPGTQSEQGGMGPLGRPPPG